MLKTKEETKTAVLDYLKSLPSTDAQVEAYTLSSISERVNIDSSKVETALSELESEDSVSSRNVRICVYVPKNEEGSRVLSGFALKEFIGYSPFWSFTFAAVIYFTLLLAFGSFQFQSNSQSDTFSSVYSMGVRNGAFLSLLALFAFAIFLQTGLTKFRRWQLVSEKSYRLIGRLFNYSMYLFIPLVVISFLTLSFYHVAIEPTTIIELLALSVASSFAYEGLVRKKLKERKGSHD